MMVGAPARRVMSETAILDAEQNMRDIACRKSFDELK